MHGADPRHDLEPWDSKVYFGTAGAAVHMVDPLDRSYRESTLADLYDIARLVDRLDHIHFFQRPIVTRDLSDPRELDLNTAYACVAGTGKHVGTSFVQPEHLDEAVAMLHLIAGGEEQWRARPFVSMSCCFVVPPLKFATDACRCLEAAVRAGMPVLLLAAGQAGATSPAALAGAVVQEVAEVLAGLVYVNLISPGHPAIFGPWPFVSDLRTGAMSGGSGEQALLTAACTQMGRFYDLPTGVPAGMTDAKLPDAQAGYEKGMTNLLAAQAGGNLIYESAGMHASLLGCCFESFVIDNDMLGAILRTVRGIEVTERQPVARRDARGLPGGARPFPRPRPDAGADAGGIPLSRGRLPPQPQGMGRAGLGRRPRPRALAAARDPRQPLPALHRAGARPPDPRALPDPPAGSADAPRQQPLVRSEVVEERAHAHDADPAICAEAQKVGIAGDDAVGTRGQRGRQHMIVIRVAAHRLDRGDVGDRESKRSHRGAKSVDGPRLRACRPP